MTPAHIHLLPLISIPHRPLLPSKAAIVQTKPQTTAPPQKAVVRPPTVRPKPKGKAAKDIPTDPNMAYRPIKHNIDNLYT